MSQRRVPWIAAVVLLFGSLWLLSPLSPSPHVRAQDDAEEREPEDERAADPEALERRLDEIEREIDRAEDRGNEEQIRELRIEGERLLDQLEAFERARRDDDEEEDHFEREIRELEVHRLGLEIDRLHVEINAVQQDSTIRLAKIADDEVTSASYALSQAIDHMDEAEAADFLSEMLEENHNRIINRLIRHHLSRLYIHMDRPDQARDVYRSLILNE